MKVAEFGVGVDFHFAEDELPTGEAAHGADKPNCRVVRLHHFALPFALERP